jgi:hypothetical protein
MAITADLLDIERIRRTMRVLPYEEAKAGAMRFLEESLGEKEALTDWELSFQQYIEAHKSSKLLFCWYARGVRIVFSPSDHHGIWGMQREGISGKGILPEYALEVLERIAKEKGLA